MATAENILFEINSTNYNNSDVFLMYKPQVGHSGFVTTLRITVNLKSIEEANFPPIPDDTPADVLQQILDQVALNTPFKEVILFFKKGTGSWVERAPIKIYNKDPYYDVNLMGLFSDSNTIDVSEDFSLGIHLKLGDTLTSIDKILVWGSAVEEKKNNGNEELAARIEALELALSGKLTEVSPNTLLGRDTTTGIIQQIPQARFATVENSVDTTSEQTIGGKKRFASTENATSSTTGTRFDGGVSIAKDLYVEGAVKQSFNHTFKAGKATNQVIPQATPTKIHISSEVSDTNNQYNHTLSRLVAVTAETWRISLYISFSLPVATRIIVSIHKNGSEALGFRVIDNSTANSTDIFIGGPFITIPEAILAPADYLEVFCWLSSTNNAQAVYGDAGLISTYWLGKRIN